MVQFYSVATVFILSEIFHGSKWSWTVFNAAGLNPSTLGGASPAPGSITHFQSSFDGLQMLNSVTPVKTYGEQVLLGPAGWHPMGGVCERVRC